MVKPKTELNVHYPTFSDSNTMTAIGDRQFAGPKAVLCNAQGNSIECLSDRYAIVHAFYAPYQLYSLRFQPLHSKLQDSGVYGSV